MNTGTQTIREVVYECTLFPYSNEYYDILKEAMELDLAEYAVEANLAQYAYEEEAQYLQSDYLFEANEEFVEGVMYEEGEVLAREEGFFSKIWNTIKKAFNKFINFWKRLFLGASKKIKGSEVYRDAIKNHPWSNDDCKWFIKTCGSNPNDLEDCLNFFKARFIKDDDIRNMRFESDVSKRDQDLVRLLMNEQLNPDDGVFVIPFLKNSDDDDAGACDPAELFAVAKEIVAAKTRPAVQAAEKHLKAVIKAGKEKGIELRKDHENVDKVLTKLEECRDDMEKYIDAAKKVAREKAEDAKELYQKGKEKVGPYVDKAKKAAKDFGDEVAKNAKEGYDEFKPGKFSDRFHYNVMKKGMKHMGGYWKARMTELMGIVVKCIGKTMNSLSWYKKLSNKAVNAYKTCESFVTDKMQKLVDAKKKYYG